MAETKIEGNKNITISISIGKYIKLKKIANDDNFSVAKLVKDGIDLLLDRHGKTFGSSKNLKTAKEL